MSKIEYSIEDLAGIIKELMKFDGQLEDLICMAQYEDDCEEVVKCDGGNFAIAVLRDMAEYHG